MTALPTGPATTIQKDIAPLDILYEDDHVLVADKPAGVVVHPTYKNKTGTLLDLLLAREWPAGARPSIVGRLDKLTSGIVVVARSAAIHAALQRKMASEASEKDYLAVVYGRIDEARGAIDLPIAHHPRDRRMMVVASGDGSNPDGCSDAGDEAILVGAASLTRFEHLASVDAPHAGLSMLRCRLVTGRRHQIRVHLAARGWPIVGDPQYGEPRWSEVADPALAETLKTFPRQALHAWRVAFDHPVTRQRVTIEAPLPRDLADLLVSARLSAPDTTDRRSDPPSAASRR